MCVIAVYEKDLELNKAELQECFYNNNDGAGFMYYDRDKDAVHISKGYFTFEELWAKLEKLPTDIDRVIHFRIATSGAINTSTCHPFPVCDSYKRMGRGDTYTEIGLAHNGVMHEYTPKLGIKSKHSDTMQFIKTMVHPLGSALWNTQVQELLEEHVSGNKFAIVAKDKLVMLGNFVQSKESGAFYSNTSYETYKNWFYTLTGYNEYEDYDFGSTFAVDLWTGAIDDEKASEYIDEFERLADSLGIFVEECEVKQFNITFFVDDATPLLDKKVKGKAITYSYNYGY